MRCGDGLVVSWCGVLVVVWWDGGMVWCGVVVCGVWCVVCGVWCVVCGVVWCVLGVLGCVGCGVVWCVCVVVGGGGGGVVWWRVRVCSRGLHNEHNTENKSTPTELVQHTHVHTTEVLLYRRLRNDVFPTRPSFTRAS